MPHNDNDRQGAAFDRAKPSSAVAEDKEPVGYKQPPKHSQFRKGQSGNPAGRPKGSLNKSTIRALVAAQWLERKIKVFEGGRERQVPRFAALLIKQDELALKGDLRAIKDVCNLLLRLAVEEPTLHMSEETATEDEAILRNHWPAVLEADEHDSSSSD